ncbi:MAG: FAD-binding oxidoreductase [Cyanobacteria bacterium J06626_14]
MTVIPTSDTRSSMIQQLQSLLGATQVVAGDDLAQPLRDRLSWAIAPKSDLPCVVYPQTQDELAEVVAYAAHHHWRLLPMGSGSKMHWGGLAEPVHLVVSTARLNQLVDHAIGDLTITAEAGMPFHSMASTLRQSNQHLGLDPAYAEQATIGGIVATGDTGALRQRYGGVRDRVIGLSFVRADGTMAKAGGRVVKNVAGYDLMKLMVGAYGTLGIISQLTFRVYPDVETSQTVVVTGEADAIQRLTAAVLASSLTPHRFDVLSPKLIQILDFGETVGLAIQFASMAVSVMQQVQQLSEMAIAQSLSVTALLQHDAESALWRQLQNPIHFPNTQSSITCKIGVLPNKAVAAIQELSDELPAEAIAHIHASSGLGTVQFDGAAIAPTVVLRLRNWCETNGGFLSVLDAPQTWKQQIDVWGYSGNALPVMQRLKSQFDPHRILNPGRFVGGI